MYNSTDDRPEACFGFKSRTADRETDIWTG